MSYQPNDPSHGSPYPQDVPGGRPPYAPTYGHGAALETGPNDRPMAVLAHLSTLIAAILSAGSLAIVGPLIMWLIYKDRSPFVRQASAGAFNFSVWLVVLGVAGWVLTATIIGAVVGVPLLILSWVLSIVFPIIGAVRANRGETYRYPLTPEFLR